MAIPDFQSIMLPLLRFCADGNEHTNQKALEALVQEFQLNEDEQKELLPSGQQRVIDNRVAWARAHMKMAELLENTRRGVFRITDRGQDVLKGMPSEINLRLLRQFPEYVAARDKRKENPGDQDCSDFEEREGKTPAEQLEAAYQTLRENLAAEILAQLKGGSAMFFERVVVEVLVKMGYGGSRKDAGEAIGRSGDEGIDGIIKEDRLGLDIIYIQAKKWEDPISRPEIQKFAGALQGKRARKGVFITTSRFCETAKEFAANIENKIILIDGQQLAQFMIDFGVGVATDAVYELKRLDSDYFSDT
ncbi:restriction endonuclease [Thiocapsa marina]|uniref:Restriction endonuclease n=1 Tax=Thiocapsa marina 5811 TaxID=768671 RepID=F9U9U2_9GAMM|nr:restriction endonuclease [Thiocapsa marina]EGV18890.1 restriction endonuclease [Thiocapsa marina 5811]